MKPKIQTLHHKVKTKFLNNNLKLINTFLLVFLMRNLGSSLNLQNNPHNQLKNSNKNQNKIMITLEKLRLPKETNKIIRKNQINIRLNLSKDLHPLIKSLKQEQRKKSYQSDYLLKTSRAFKIHSKNKIFTKLSSKNHNPKLQKLDMSKVN